MVQLSPYEAYSILQPLMMFILGLAIYSIIVYNLYRFVAKRDIFELDLRQYNTLEHGSAYKFFAIILYFVEYIFFFPLFLMVWFIAFSLILMALSNTNTANTVFLLSMAIISSVRIASYYNQSLSKDLAKLLPFGLLAVVLMEDASSFLSLDRAVTMVKELPTEINTLLYYFGFVIVLEFLLRIIYSISKALSNRDKTI